MIFIFVLLFSVNAYAKIANDAFDKLIQVYREDTVSELIKLFGKPEEILQEKNPNLVLYKYSEFKAAVNKKTKEVVGTSMSFWKDFDAYAFLKERFQNYKWVEIPVKSSNIDVIEERYQVEIPEVGISFEYDNQDPLRRPLFIFFK